MFMNSLEPATSQRPAITALRIVLAIALLIAIAWAGFSLHADSSYGPKAAFTLLTGAIFGILLQRTRFCWFCNLRDAVVNRDAGPLLGILAALIVGSLGYAAIFGAWIIDPSAGHLPPKAHIGPMSWVVFAGGLIFGIGMSLSGSCISAHLYRLGEGSLLAPVALLGIAGGFMLGLHYWDFFYLRALQEAPVTWLPTKWGYAGTISVQLGVLFVIAILLWRYVSRNSPTPSIDRSWRSIFRAIFVHRWPSWLGGGLIGGLSAIVLLRTQPLGVTAEFHRLSRELGTRLGFVSAQLEGIDGFRGCRAITGETLFTTNALFILALIAGAFAAALLANQFKPKRESLRAFILAAIGGIFLGFGSVLSLGCSIGTALSGVMAFALSGWAFLATMIVGVLITLPIRRALLK